MRAITDCGFEHPSQVQFEVIPQAILGTDVICQANSGMGKTAVFVLSVLQQISAEDGTSCLILAHTRELAYQISHEYVTRPILRSRRDPLPPLVSWPLNKCEIEQSIRKRCCFPSRFGRFTKYMPNIKASVFFGGLPIVQDRATLKKDPPHIVIGTPGRILALANEKALDLKKIKFFVLDECDSLLEPIGTLLLYPPSLTAEAPKAVRKFAY